MTTIVDAGRPGQIWSEGAMVPDKPCRVMGLMFRLPETAPDLHKRCRCRPEQPRRPATATPLHLASDAAGPLRRIVSGRRRRSAFLRQSSRCAHFRSWKVEGSIIGVALQVLWPGAVLRRF